MRAAPAEKKEVALAEAMGALEIARLRLARSVEAEPRQEAIAVETVLHAVGLLNARSKSLELIAESEGEASGRERTRRGRP